MDWAFNQRFVARALKREHVLCLGDSHVEVLGRVRVKGVWFRTKSLGGATASGILNPNSATHSFSTFKALLERAQPWQRVLFQLGEVDCGFVIWHRALRHGISVDQQLEMTLDSYEKFLLETAELGFPQIIVLSAPLPTISDYPSQFAEVANLRREVTASMAERTDLTLRFNASLCDRCDVIGARFVDVSTDQLDTDRGVIRKSFLRDSDRDHHLADRPYASLIESRLSWLKH